MTNDIIIIGMLYIIIILQKHRSGKRHKSEVTCERHLPTRPARLADVCRRSRPPDGGEPSSATRVFILCVIARTGHGKTQGARRWCPRQHGGHGPDDKHHIAAVTDQQRRRLLRSKYSHFI